jgi:hypothetical protein
VEHWLFQRRALGPAATLYYDLVWYQTVGRRLLTAFRQTAWGRLFASYASH